METSTLSLGGAAAERRFFTGMALVILAMSGSLRAAADEHPLIAAVKRVDQDDAAIGFALPSPATGACSVIFSAQCGHAIRCPTA